MYIYIYPTNLLHFVQIVSLDGLYKCSTEFVELQFYTYRFIEFTVYQV